MNFGFFSPSENIKNKGKSNLNIMTNLGKSNQTKTQKA